MTQIIPLSLAPGGMLNTYLVRGSKTILVDAGLRNFGPSILRKMAQHGVSPGEISLILLTHGHADHAGSVVELRKTIDAPVAISSADAPLLQNGANVLPPSRTVMGSIIRLALGSHPKFPAYQPDVLVDEGFDTSPYGVNLRVLAMPGHTAGMIALLTEENEVIAADAFGGKPLSPRQPTVMYLNDDHVQAEASLRKLAALHPRRYYIGHGGPVECSVVERWLDQAGPKG